MRDRMNQAPLQEHDDGGISFAPHANPVNGLRNAGSAGSDHCSCGHKLSLPDTERIQLIDILGARAESLADCCR